MLHFCHSLQPDPLCRSFALSIVPLVVVPLLFLPLLAIPSLHLFVSTFPALSLPVPARQRAKRRVCFFACLRAFLLTFVVGSDRLPLLREQTSSRVACFVAERPEDGDNLRC